jgi:uncharacterized repeat protein (TIGR01451 family)
MKNSLLKSIAFSFLCMLSANSFSQGFQINSLSSATNGYLLCDSVVDLSFSAVQYSTNSGADIDLLIGGTNFQPSQFQITINWGDGSTSSHFGGVSSEGLPVSLNPPASHIYSTSGTHIIVVTVNNPQNNSSAIYTIQASTAYCSAYIYAPANVDCNNDGTVEYQISQGLPLIFTSGTNQYSDTTLNNTVDISGMPLGTYTISVDPAWLNANGFLATIMPQTITITGPTTTFTTQILLICLPTAPNTQCVTGTVFCDANANGIFDAGEAPIPNAPISIQTNTGITITTTSNGNGYYSTTYNAPNQTPAVVMLNPNWLSQNGYSVNPYIYTTIQTDCSQQNAPINFPITNCNTPPPNQGCISGYVWCDANGDGDFDANELPLAGAPITLQGSVNNVTIYSDSNGLFVYCGSMLNMTTVIGTINPNWLATHGYTISNPNYVMIFMPSLNTQPLGFGVNCGGIPNTCADLWTTVTPWIGYYQNQTNYIRLNYGNYGPGAPGNYTVTLTFPAGVTPITSSISNTNYVISGNTITWTLSSASPSFAFDDVIYFNTPSGIPSGTAHYFTSTITPTGSVSDCCTTNNAGSLLQLVGNSYDPNDKSVNLEEGISPVIQDELTYTIRFQNTGTAPAQDVFIIDTLSANLDWSTIEVIEATHAMHLIDLGGGVIRFDFPQIWLADSTTNEPMSHGHVVFKIKELVTNTEGSQIYNTGHIYFDWNPAIVTNTTYNVNATLGINELENQVLVYPNPVGDLVTIQGNANIISVELVSISGQLIETYTPEATVTSINTASLSTGIYLLQIRTENGLSTKKILKK